MRVLLGLSLLTLIGSASAEELTLTRGYEEPVCSAVGTALDSLNNRLDLRMWSGSNQITFPKWQETAAFVVEARPFSVDYTNIDVNNDGKADLVLRPTLSLSNHEYQDLWLVDSKTVDVTKTPVSLSKADLSKGFIRQADTQFRYLGIGGPSVLEPFVFQNTTYILVSDETAARAANNPPLLVVRYLDKKIVVARNRHDPDRYTNDAQVICVFH